MVSMIPLPQRASPSTLPIKLWKKIRPECEGRFLPFGRASIASGYTPATVPGRCPEPRFSRGAMRKES